MANRARYKRKSQGSQSMFLVCVVVLIIFVAVAARSYQLLEKEKVYQAKEESLQTQIESEQARAEEIEEFEKYTQTRKYIEEIAKDKLGLVYPGEIIFKNDSEEN
jgi:cell division protein FtsB